MTFMNPVKWWIGNVIHVYFWATKGRKSNPKPMTEPRDEAGHLKRRCENGKWVEA
jgi:hypothetical protein